MNDLAPLVGSLTLESLGRKYRGVDAKGHAPLAAAYLPPQDLWNRLDAAETAIALYARNWPFGSAASFIVMALVLVSVTVYLRIRDRAPGEGT